MPDRASLRFGSSLQFIVRNPAEALEMRREREREKELKRKREKDREKSQEASMTALPEGPGEQARQSVCKCNALVSVCL